MVAHVGRVVTRATTPVDEWLAGGIVESADAGDVGDVGDVDGARVEQCLPTQDTGAADGAGVISSP